KTGDFYELQAIPTSQAQKIDGLFEAGEWQGYVLKLNAKRQVIRGIQFWKGASDVSAALNAVRQGEDLCIRPEVTDDQLSEGDSVRLVNEKGLGIGPKEIKTTPTPKGYNVEARYSMRDLVKLALDRVNTEGDLDDLLSQELPLQRHIDFTAAVEII